MALIISVLIYSFTCFSLSVFGEKVFKTIDGESSSLYLNPQNLTGKYVCTEVKQNTTNIKQTIEVPKVTIERVFCWKLPSFRCTEHTTIFVDEQQEVRRTTHITTSHCCDGYVAVMSKTNSKESVCEASCDPTCAHGLCAAPNKCKCDIGYGKAGCDFSCSHNRYGDDDCGKDCGCNKEQSNGCEPVSGRCFCKRGYVGKHCDEMCSDGRFGDDCKENCLCQNNADCEHRTGQCQCKPGFSGTFCQDTCTHGDAGCKIDCPCKNGGTCDRSGACVCKDGWKGHMCEKPCDGDTYGPSCKKKCDCLNMAYCDHVSGSCTCTDGFKGDRCEEACPRGWFGHRCVQECKCQQPRGTCDAVTGKCTCNAGFTGPSCQIRECPNGYYGRSNAGICQSKCKCHQSNSELCHPISGGCYCRSGWEGKHCNYACKEGFYGKGCHNLCGYDCNGADGIRWMDTGFVNFAYVNVHVGSRKECKNNAHCDPFTGKCLCKPGYRGQVCSEACDGATWGQACAQQCSCTASGTVDRGATCSVANGTCACQTGYQSYDCSMQCSARSFGDQCDAPCSCFHGSGCFPETGECVCAIGYRLNDCREKCSSGTYGIQCMQQCPSVNTTNIDVDLPCNHVTGDFFCSNGRYGRRCAARCMDLTKWGSDCDRRCDCSGHGSCDETGKCVCNDGYMGGKCENECDNGFFGHNCAYQCGKGGLSCVWGAPKNGRTCSHVDGSCHCAAGYTGVRCEQACPAGFYGDNCASRCRCTVRRGKMGLGNFCDPVTGTCQCVSGKTGATCTDDCPLGTFGPRCTQKCPICLNGAKCDPLTGECLCLDGFIGFLCQHSCQAGRYGSGCAKTCTCAADSVRGMSCNPINGECTCPPGRYGIGCSKVCQQWRYGAGCALQCSCGKNSVGCDPESGACICKPNWLGINCEQECASEDNCMGAYAFSKSSPDKLQSSNVKVIVPVVLILIILVVLLGFGMCYYRKKYQKERDPAFPTVTFRPEHFAASDIADNQFNNPVYQTNNGRVSDGSLGPLPNTSFGPMPGTACAKMGFDQPKRVNLPLGKGYYDSYYNSDVGSVLADSEPRYETIPDPRLPVSTQAVGYLSGSEAQANGYEFVGFPPRVPVEENEYAVPGPRSNTSGGTPSRMSSFGRADTAPAYSVHSTYSDGSGPYEAPRSAESVVVEGSNSGIMEGHSNEAFLESPTRIANVNTFV